MSVRVKICGLTNLEDASAAIDAGADALGFVFCDSSPRCIAAEVAARIVAALPPFTTRVGLFVNAPAGLVQQTVQACGMDSVQLHGDETPVYCQGFHVKVIKAFRVRDESFLAALPRYPVAAWLLDSFVPGKSGGTGERFNWELARQAVQLDRPVILAGGLNPWNVADAVRQVQPYAVDVSSGVESSPGKKDHHKIRDFIQAAKAAA